MARTLFHLAQLLREDGQIRAANAFFEQSAGVRTAVGLPSLARQEQPVAGSEKNVLRCFSERFCFRFRGLGPEDREQLALRIEQALDERAFAPEEVSEGIAADVFFGSPVSLRNRGQFAMQLADPRTKDLSSVQFDDRRVHAFLSGWRIVRQYACHTRLYSRDSRLPPLFLWLQAVDEGSRFRGVARKGA